MKPKLYVAIFISAALGYANAQTTLFDDTYTRANLNSGQTGGGGQTGADVGSGISYTVGQWNVAANSAYTGSTASANNSGPNIATPNNGTLFKQNNGNMGIWSLNYNFTDAAILSAGGFSVSQNIISVGSNVNQPTDRYNGYGVGLSPTQISGFADDTASNSGPRGSVNANGAVPGQTTGGVAPFYVDLDISGQVQVFEANTLGGTNSGLVYTSGMLLNANVSGSLSTPATLTTDFYFSDFNAGSTVNYGVFLTTNNVTMAVTSGSFTWDTTGDNYIAGSMRGNTITAGELNVSTVPEPSAVAMMVGGLGAIGLLIRRRNI